MLPNISTEQQDILNKISDNNNTIVDSVAGSGKTTTSLQIAIHNINKKILLLTYNSRLKTETRRKVLKFLENNINIQMEVHSYHSFNVKYYNKTNYTDIGIVQTLNKNIIINKPINFDILILDEAQDITETFYRFINKIFFDTCTKNTQICILGDKNQSIFDFNNADNRYLTFANKIFNFTDKKWLISNLSTSYRITNQIANFVNNNMLSYNRLNATKDGKLVKYMIIDVYNDHMAIFKQIDNFIKSDYTYSDIFILAPSVKSETTPVKTLANFLSIVKNINIYVSSDDNETIDEELLKGKLVITTFHQVKGLERKIVFVTCFDNSYYDYYKRDETIDKSRCPNEMYVSCTRAIETLIVVHHKQKPKLQFLNTDKIIDNCNIYYQNIINKYEQILSDTNLSHIDIIWEIDLNCKDYLPKKITNLFENLSCTELIKYTMLPKLNKITKNSKNPITTIYKNIKKYIKLLLNNGYKSKELLIITITTTTSTIISELYNYLSDKINDTHIIYTKNINNMDLIKVILYYDFIANRPDITITDTFYVKHNKNINISSFKILFNEIISYQDCCQVIDKLYIYKPTSKKIDTQEAIVCHNVTNLCKFLPTTIMSQILNLLKYNQTATVDDNKTNIQWKDKQQDIYESVCTITGQAIPALFEYYTNGRISIIKELKTKIMDKIILFNYKLVKCNKNSNILEYCKKYKTIIAKNINFGDKIKKIVECVGLLDIKFVKTLKTEIKVILLFKNFIEAFNYYDDPNNIDIVRNIINDNNNDNNNNDKMIINILKLTNLFNCVLTGYYHLLKQIKFYNWLNIDLVKIIIKRLINNVSNNTIFECTLVTNNTINDISPFKSELKNNGLRGMIDCYDIKNNILWEFKCVKNFSSDHFIQLALYAYLLYKHTAISNNKNFNLDTNGHNTININDTIYYLNNNSFKKGKILGICNLGIYNETKIPYGYELYGNKMISFNQIIYNETNKTLINYIKLVKYDENTKFNLFNLFTGEIYSLEFNYENLKTIVGTLIEHKISSHNKISDDEFMERIQKYKINMTK